MTGSEKGLAGDAQAGPVFVNGVWKSGNHLVYSALNELGIQGPYNGIASHLLFGRYRMLKRLLRGAANGIDVGLEMEARISRTYIRRTLRRLQGCIVGGHAAYSPELITLMHEERARVIIIRRDPRDILVSFADWIGGRADFYLHRVFAPLSREDRVALLLRGGPTAVGWLPPFPEILLRGEGWLDAEGVLQVSFEDLVGAAGGGSITAQAQAIAALHSHVAAPQSLDAVDPTTIYGKSLTFNEGRSRRWLELDDLALMQEIADKIGPHLARWGYAE